MTRKRGRNLTDEEKSLWNRVAKKIKPLLLEKKRIVSTPSKPHSPTRQKSIPLPPPEAPASYITKPPTSHRIQRVRKVEIEARLDLHGYTREQARLALARFLIACQARQCLWVLVITGKGRRRLNEDGTYESPTNKNLRDLVPQWLEESHFHSVVSAYTTAKPHDGGSGALYVRLKRIR